jgi:hypothetical protein
MVAMDVLKQAARVICGLRRNGKTKALVKIDPRLIPTTPWRVVIKTRILRERNREARSVHTLTRLIGPEDPIW